MSRVVFIASILWLSLLASYRAQAEEPKAAPGQPAGIAVVELKRETPVDFEKEILPVFKSSCLACHNQTKAKGGLNLETPQLMLKGGDTGPAAIAGKSTESLILKAASHVDPELIMPPRDNKANAPDLTPEQLALLKLWIDQGAKGEVRATTPVNWLDKPPALDPIFAVALTQDGQFAACGRGNRIDVYHVPSGRAAVSLVDPKFYTAAGLTNAAHRDLVNALAFNPDGTLLVSAAFREVKLWRRPRDVQRFSVSVSNPPAAFAISSDRKRLALATDDHRIEILEFPSGRPLNQLVGHSNRVTSLRFSADNALLASGSADKTVRIWKLSEGAPVATAETIGEVRAVAWLADGKQFAAAGSDGTIQILNVEGLGLARELKAHAGAVNALDAFPGGKELLSGGDDGMVRQWKVDEDKAVRELKHEGAVTALAVRPDGKRFASAGTNGMVKLWNGEDGKLVAELKGDRYADELAAEAERTLIVAKSTTEFHEKAVETADAENKKQIERVAKATSTNTFTEKVFLEKEKALKEAESAKVDAEKALTNLLAEIQKVTEDFENADKSAKDAAVKTKAAADKATQAQLASERASFSRTEAERIAADTTSVAAKTKAALSNADAAKDTAQRIADESAAVAAKSKTFAEAVAADAEMKAKQAVEAKIAAEKMIEEVAALSFAAGRLKPAYDKTVAEAPEKRKQATNQIESTTKALAGAEQEFKRAETRKSVTGHELELALGAAQRASNGLATVKSVLEDAVAYQRKTEGEVDRLKKAVSSLVRPVRLLAFSPDNLTLATFGNDGHAHTWSAENGAPFEVFGRSTAPGGNTSALPALAFLDSQTLLAANGERELVAWDLNPMWIFERAIGTGDLDSPFADRVNAVRFSPDGNVIATGGGEPTRSGEIKLWNAADGKFLREFANVHSDAVLSLDFSPDGKYLASSSADRFVRVVDLASAKVVKAFEGHTSYVLGVAWKRDSRTLASAGADNVIKIWDFVTGERKKNIDGAGKEVTSIAFVGVTDQAVATSGDSQVRLLRANGEKVRSFEGATEFMNCGAATPDGRAVVAGGQDGVLHVWNGTNGQKIASFAPNR